MEQKDELYYITRILDGETEYFSYFQFSTDICRDTFLFKFYSIIAVLALVLLGLDYWVRKKYKC